MAVTTPTTTSPQTKGPGSPGDRLPWIWDYDLDEDTFMALLCGERTIGPLDRDWAVLRLLEYTPWRDIVQRLGFPALVAGWAGWRDRVRSTSRQRGLDFAVVWVREHRPDLAA